MAFPITYWATKKQVDAFLFVQLLYMRNKQRTFLIQDKSKERGGVLKG